MIKTRTLITLSIALLSLFFVGRVPVLALALGCIAIYFAVWGLLHDDEGEK